MKPQNQVPNRSLSGYAESAGQSIGWQYLVGGDSASKSKSSSSGAGLVSTVQPSSQPSYSANPKPHHARNDMRIVLILVGFLGLLLLFVPYFLSLEHQISVGTNRRMMFVGVVLWGLCALFWKRRNLDQEDLLN